MKILSIEIAGFGKWQQKTIEFSDGNQLIYGKNEAGKSTIYQFVQAMLFGFPAKGKKKKNYIPKGGGSYGGRLWLEHPVYGNVQIERYKELNKGQAKVYIGEQVGDEALLQQILHPLTKELFQTVFTFQQEQLTQLEKLDEDELQTSLLALGISGSNQMLKIREGYNKQAQEIYKSKGSRPTLNVKLELHGKLTEKIRRKEQEEQQYNQILAELTETETAMIEQRTAVAQLKQRLEALEKQLLSYPLFEEWQQLKKKQLNTAIVVEEDEKDQLLSLYQEYKFLKEEQERLNRVIQSSVAHHDQSGEYLFYLNEEEAIKGFLDKRYTIGKLLSEIEWMTQSLEQNTLDMRKYEQKWGWTEEQPPRLFFEDRQLVELREGIVSRKVELQTAEEEQRTLEANIRSQEKNLEDFESVNQRVFQQERKNKQQPLQRKKIGGLAAAAAVICFVAAFLLSDFLRWGVLGLGILCLATAAFLLLLPQKDTVGSIKKQWQQKLSNLDYLNEQLYQVKGQIARLHEEEEHLQTYIQQQTRENHLGGMDRLEYWMNHKEDIKRYLLLISTTQELQRQIKEDKETANQWLRQTERFVTWLPIIGKGLAERLTIISDFADEMEQLRFSQGNNADIYTKQSLKEVREKQQQVLEAARPLLYDYQILAIEDVPEKLQSYTQNEAVGKRLEELQPLVIKLYPKEITEQQLLAQKYEQSALLTAAEEDILRLQKEEQRLLYKRQQMIEDGTLDSLYQELAGLEAEIEELAVDWSGYRISEQLVLDLLTELSEQQLPALLKHAVNYFKLLTDQKYTDIQLYEGKLQLKDTSGQRFAVYDLSTGTKDQLIMAIRFAFLSLQGEKSIFPIMVDDGWLHYDHERKRHLARLFQLFGENQQIICFSSDQEMVSYYQENKQSVVQLEGNKDEKNS
ncbi:AAA family ATPase [uncultured Enterococcus sp.]|uniref:ATP-binding protein n=1 Tax=uncultured Enterococcus sp. TaxID=167972 RepID=UPI002AA87029|nr:AAA family ATPase [uncultured Enterococcus sp.]